MRSPSEVLFEFKHSKDCEMLRLTKPFIVEEVIREGVAYVYLIDVDGDKYILGLDGRKKTSTLTPILIHDNYKKTRGYENIRSIAISLHNSIKKKDLSLPEMAELIGIDNLKELKSLMTTNDNQKSEGGNG